MCVRASCAWALRSFGARLVLRGNTDGGRCNTTGRVRYGFTLVELLVVIAIIGVLVGLILPAVQAARESARRTQCLNNLKQIGVGISNFLTVKEKFPVGCIGCGMGINEMHSWNTQLLPFIEQDPLARKYRLDKTSYDPVNQAAGATVLSIFLCPSTIEEELHSPSGRWKDLAFTDYGGIYGVEGTGHDAPFDGTSRQFLARQWLGVFLNNEAVTAAQISDGLSNTVSIAERKSRRGYASEWPSGRNIFAQEKETPINHISGLGNEIGSPHPGGALVAYCDGHVAFIPEELEQQILNAMLTKEGGETP